MVREVLIGIQPKVVIDNMDQDGHTEITLVVTLTDTEGIEVISEHQVAVNDEATLSLRMPPDGLLTSERRDKA